MKLSCNQTEGVIVSISSITFYACWRLFKSVCGQKDNKKRPSEDIGIVSSPSHYSSAPPARRWWLHKCCRSNQPERRWRKGWGWGGWGKSDTSLCGCDLLFSVWSSPPPNPSGGIRTCNFRMRRVNIQWIHRLNICSKQIISVWKILNWSTWLRRSFWKALSYTLIFYIVYSFILLLYYTAEVTCIHQKLLFRFTSTPCSC